MAFSVSVNGKELPTWASVLTAPIWVPITIIGAALALVAAGVAAVGTAIMSPFGWAFGKKEETSNFLDNKNTDFGISIGNKENSFKTIKLEKSESFAKQMPDSLAEGKFVKQLASSRTENNQIIR